MRTTMTLDDDVAARLEQVAQQKKLPFKTVVNDALRAGLAALDKPAPKSAVFKTKGFDLGPSLVGSLDNVEDVIARVEGEGHR